MAMLGPQELWPILIVAILLFGAKKLPELAKGLGEGMREFKHAVHEVQEDEPAKPAKSAAVETKPEEK
ncbi:MAG TPA: twin-arginine translocase TatA/TatE family subunit [Armatimonadota bacterium]